MCGSGELESVYHVVIECAAYTRTRAEFLLSISELLGEELIKEWNESGMCMCIHSRCFFSAKKHLECMWQIYSRILRNRRNEMLVVRNDHGYARV